MLQTSQTPHEFHHEAAFAASQHATECWSRAFSHLSEGLMTAAKAQTALATEVFKSEPNGWLRPITPDNAAEVTHEWLASRRARRDILLHGIRQIRDDLTACFFTVAEELTEGLNFKNGKVDGPGPVPAAEKPVGPNVSAVEAAAPGVATPGDVVADEE